MYLSQVRTCWKWSWGEIETNFAVKRKKTNFWYLGKNPKKSTKNVARIDNITEEGEKGLLESIYSIKCPFTIFFAFLSFFFKAWTEETSGIQNPEVSLTGSDDGWFKLSRVGGGIQDDDVELNSSRDELDTTPRKSISSGGIQGLRRHPRMMAQCGVRSNATKFVDCVTALDTKYPNSG